jgi:hypothetical protein
MKQTIIWTALPNGVIERVSKRYLQLAVFVSPRLESDPSAPKLEPFDFLEWPKNEFEFEVEFGSGKKLKATRVAPAPELELWTALFKPTTYVKPYEYQNLAQNVINSFPTKRVADFLREKYVKIATDPKFSFEKPGIEHMREMFNPIIKVHENPLAIKELLKPLSKVAASVDARTLAVSIANKVKKSELDFHLVKTFFERPNVEWIPKPLELDFHQVTAMLCQYPELNKRMGLVINLEVPYDPFIPTSARLRVLPTWKTKAKITPMEQKPWTQYILKNTARVKNSVFIIASRPVNPDSKDGYMIIQNSAKADGSSDPCHIDIIDHDGLSLKLLNTMANLMDRSKFFVEDRFKAAAIKRPELTSKMLPADSAKAVQAAKAQSDAIPDFGLPATRSAGVTLVRNGRAEIVQKKFLAQNAIYSEANKVTGDVTLYAEDVVRGYRIDVWDINTKKWHSLHKRKGTYKFIDTALTREYADEGFIQTGATKYENKEDADLYIHEALVRWDGWSLSVPRPGLTIMPDGALAEENVEAGAEFRLETSFSVQPGTLPKLRFGTEYFLRARMVDLAGNSVPFVELPDSFKVPTVSRKVTYARFEPVPSPTVVEFHEPQGGDSLERVVIRSNYDTLPASIEPDQRHIAPPPTSQMMSETHGKFDAAKGLNKLAYDVIAGREGTFEAVDGKQIPHPELVLNVPYLPDPMASGATFQGLPGFKGEVLVPFVQTGKGWLDALPFRLKVMGIEADDSRLLKNAKSQKPKLTVENGRQVLLVQLSKAEMIKVRLSSYMIQANLNNMGLWQWVASYGAAVIEKMKQLAVKGRLWMIEPYREIVLVHAVQKPLIAPDLTTASVSRKAGAAYANLNDFIQISGKSTIEVEITGEWNDYIDDIRKDMWEVFAAKAHVCDIPVKQTDTKLRFSEKHEFGDTKHRKVKYTAAATSRFKEYFPPGTDLIRKSITIERNVPSSARPDAPKMQREQTSEVVAHRKGLRLVIVQAKNVLAVACGYTWIALGFLQVKGSYSVLYCGKVLNRRKVKKILSSLMLLSGAGIQSGRQALSIIFHQPLILKKLLTSMMT